MKYLRIRKWRTFPSDILIIHHLIAHEGYLYAITWNSPGKILKIDPEDFSYVEKDLETNEGNDMVVAKGYIWAITYAHRGVFLYRIDPSTLEYKAWAWNLQYYYYPMSICYDGEDTLWIGCVSEYIVKIDISDVDYPEATFYTTPERYYHHSIHYLNGKVVTWGLDHYPEWPPDKWVNYKIYFMVFDPDDETISEVEIDYPLTDDCADDGQWVYIAVETVPGQPQKPFAYRIDPESLVVELMEFDPLKCTNLGDSAFYDASEDKIFFGFRPALPREGTIIRMDPTFTNPEIEYFHTVIPGENLHFSPEEIVKIGDKYYAAGDMIPKGTGSIFRGIIEFTIEDAACSEITTKEECEAAGCYWYDDSCHSEPKKKCEDYTTKEECEAAGCYWYDDSCHSTPQGVKCSDFTDERECYIHSCYWWDDACHDEPPPCSYWKTKEECINAGCYWYNNACHDKPPENCEVLDNKEDCEAAGCYWYNNSCHEKPPECPDFNNKEECEAAGCYWYDDACHSEPKKRCEDITTKDECLAAGCYWYDDACHSEPAENCERFTTKEECEAAGCYWYDGACHGEPQIKKPIAVIDAIYPNPATKGEEVYFEGHGVTEGSILAYEWSSDKDGVIGNRRLFSRSDLSVGTHTISFKVKDNLYGWSEPDTATLVIKEKEEAPSWWEKHKKEIVAGVLCAAGVGVAILALRKQ